MQRGQGDTRGSGLARPRPLLRDRPGVRHHRQGTAPDSARTPETGHRMGRPPLGYRRPRRAPPRVGAGLGGRPVLTAYPGRGTPSDRTSDDTRGDLRTCHPVKPLRIPSSASRHRTLLEMWRDHYPLWPERLTPMRGLPRRLTVNVPNPPLRWSPTPRAGEDAASLLMPPRFTVGCGTRIRTQSRFRPRAGRETCPVRSWCLWRPDA